MDLKDLFELLDLAEIEVAAEKENQGSTPNTKDRRIHNQRKVINKQANEIKDLKASLAFRDSEVDLLVDDNDTLIDDINDYDVELDRINRRYHTVKKQNAQNKGKLVNLAHVLNRETSPVALR